MLCESTAVLVRARRVLDSQAGGGSVSHWSPFGYPWFVSCVIRMLDAYNVTSLKSGAYYSAKILGQRGRDSLCSVRVIPMQQSLRVQLKRNLLFAFLEHKRLLRAFKKGGFS